MFDENLFGSEEQTRKNLQANKQSNLVELKTAATVANAHIRTLTSELKDATQKFQQHAQNCQLPSNARTGDTKKDAQLAEAYLLWRFIKEHHAGNPNNLSPSLKARYDNLPPNPKDKDFEKICRQIHYPGSEALDKWVREGYSLLTREATLDHAVQQLQSFVNKCDDYRANYDTIVKNDPEELQSFLTGLKTSSKGRLTQSTLDDLKNLTCPSTITSENLKKEVDYLIERIKATANDLQTLQDALQKSHDQKELQEEYEWHACLLRAEINKLHKFLQLLEKTDAYKGDKEVSDLHKILKEARQHLPKRKDMQIPSTFNNTFKEWKDGGLVDITDETGKPLEIDDDVLESAKREFVQQAALKKGTIDFAPISDLSKHLIGLLIVGPKKLTFKNAESKAAFLKIYKKILDDKLKARKENEASAQGQPAPSAPGVSATLQQWRQSYRLNIVDQTHDDKDVQQNTLYIWKVPNEAALYYKVQDANGNLQKGKISKGVLETETNNQVQLTPNFDLKNIDPKLQQTIGQAVLSITSKNGHTQPNSQIIIPNTGNPHHSPAPTPAP